jgi:putative phosphoribosyl transferase
MFHLPFMDRTEAGRLLATELNHRKVIQNAVIVALTKGGVPVGFAVADRLRLPLEVIVARKISIPWQPELTMGAIAGTARILDKRITTELGISDLFAEEIVAEEQEEVRRQEELYRAGKPPIDLRGQSVILVDDGLATGNTMLAAIRHTRRANPARIIIGTPVGSEEACNRVRKEADDLVCLAMPRLFFAIGEWYRDFQQVSEAEVRSLLSKSSRRFRTSLTSPTAAMTSCG